MKVSDQFSLLNSFIRSLSKPKVTLLEKYGTPFILMVYGNHHYYISDAEVTCQIEGRGHSTPYSLSRKETNLILGMADTFIRSHKEKFPKLHDTLERNAKIAALKKRGLNRSY